MGTIYDVVADGDDGQVLPPFPENDGDKQQHRSRDREDAP